MTEARLRNDVHPPPGMANPYKFFPLLLQTNVEIQASCRTFQEKVFPGMVEVGVGMRTYAELATKTDETGTEGSGADLFGIIKSMLTAGAKDDALNLLEVMEQTVVENIARSKVCAQDLGTLKSDLEVAQGTLTQAQTALEAEDDIIEKSIETLKGTGEGSLTDLRKKLTAPKAEYKRLVTIAATAPTYAWINFPIPIGLMSAVAVASIYEPQATAAADAIKDLERQFETMTDDLKLAIASAGVLDSGRDEIEGSLAQVALAIRHTQAITNSWTDIQGSLGGLKTFLDLSTKGGKLSSAVATFLDQMAKKWTELNPMLVTLTTNPHIVVEPGEFSFKDLAEKIETEVTAATNKALGSETFGGG